jgi:actin related protein 2/3 complex subunit 5
MDVLSSVKSTEIPALVKTLNENQLDLLMKYVFKGMAAPEKFNSSTLLQWHEKVLL